MSLFVVLALLVTQAGHLGAQDLAKLRSTKTFRCMFTASARGNMDRDLPILSTGIDSLELVFDSVDPEKGTGRLIGNVGAGDVAVMRGSEHETIVERTDSGTLQVTVIYMAQRRDGQFKAVHSRHTAAPGGIPIASQMYGSCRGLI